MAEFMAFIEMGGYAFYVWSSYALALIVLSLNVIIPRRRERALLESLTQFHQREEAHATKT